MIDILRERNELDNTIIMVTSDNGRSLFWGHGEGKGACYDMGTRVPLAVCGPGVGKGTRVVTDPVSFVDFAPTVLAVAGIPIPG